MAKSIENLKHEGVFRDSPAIGHSHTYYSISDAPQSPNDYVKRCVELGFKSAALNDHGTLLGVHPFMDACKKHGINGIPGVEAYSKVCPEVLDRLKNYEEFLDGRTHLIVDPKNYHGYQKIAYAMRDANLHIEKLIKLTYPIMTCDILEEQFKDCDDVFATSACAQGAIGYILLTNFRMKKKLGKEQAICDETKDAYEKFVAKNEEKNRLSDKIKALKKEKTEQSKFLKAAFNKKIQKLKDKTENTLIRDEEAEAELRELLNAQNNANARIPMIESELETLELDLRNLKVEINLSEIKKEANKYTKAMEKINAQSYISDEELYECAKIQLMYYKSIFKTFFVEIQYHGIDNEEYIMPILLRLADETNTPIIAANDAHVSSNTESSFEARRIIRYNYFNRAQKTESADRELYIKTDWELIDALATVIPRERAEEAVRNTDIFNQCSVVFPKESHYPSVKLNETFEELLEIAKAKKIEKGEWNDVYEERLQHEIKTITKMGYIDYHLVVMDFCNEARLLGRIPKEELDKIPENFDDVEKWINDNNFSNGVGVGPGRGSAAGSLVCYLLGITNIDPIKYNLLFERFLNPERVSMPDIDSDIKTSLRPTIIKYLKWKYGEKAVCSIATETTYAARGAVQMAGRERASQLYDHLPEKDAKPLRQQYLYGVTLKVSDMIPEKPGVTLADCEADFQQNFVGNKEAELIWEHAKLLEGRISGTGVHAGGVIISDNDNVNDYIALAWNEEKNVWAAQCDMVKAEEVGLLKMDLLGLSTLDAISDCIHLVKKYRNEDIDIDNISFEPEVFAEIYAKGNTNSVFQFESSGMKSMLKDFKPTCFEDLIVLVACYRPGPMQYLDNIIAVKNGKKALTYKVPELESILSSTYGATVYQEQVMQIFQKLAGYSLGAADMVRRAMSKKKEEKLAIERESFVNGDPERNIDGCVKRGISSQHANELFDEMMDFAKYAFNKSHAAAYALVSYQTAWLKYHYPVEYLCGLFNTKSQDDFEPLYTDCKLYDIKVLPPDINSSYNEFVVEDGNIRYGFSGIKGLGVAMKDFFTALVDERKHGNYNSIQDFLKRNFTVEDGKVNLPSKKVLESLINAGAFDGLGYNREALLNATIGFSVTVLEGENPEEIAKNTLDSIQVMSVPKDVSYNMSKEMEYLGSILSENPLDVYDDDDVYNCTPIDSLSVGRTSIFGFVTSAELKKSSKGNNMIIMTIQGKTGTCTVFAMNMLYDSYASNLDLLEHHVVKIGGTVNDGGTMFANTISDLKPVSDSYFMDLASAEDTEFVTKLRSKKLSTSGDVTVTVQFHFRRNKETKQLYPCVPAVYEYSFTEEEILAIKKHGIKLQKWSANH